MLIRFCAIFLMLAGATSVRAADDFCFDCHAIQEGTSVKFKNDIHYKKTLSCADCHGGDAKLNDMNKSKLPETGFRVRVKRQEVPLFCAGCHGNAKFMEKYNAKAIVNQFALYSRSVHGRKLAAGTTEAAQCGDCHGVHDARAVADPESSANPKNIVETCGMCHPETAEVFKKSPHAGKGNTPCVACHGSHEIEPATTALLTNPETGCGKCHKPATAAGKAGAEIAELLKGLESGGADSKEALARARLAAHSVSVAAVKKAMEAPATKAAGGK
jgi:hypothetical protein